MGVTLDIDADGRSYRVPRAYVDAVLAAGGLPILLPYVDREAAGAYLALCDGLVLTGGDFDLAPELYGEVRRASCGPSRPERTRFEQELCGAALDGRIPLLGVCGGMQLLNVVRGGTLFQDLPEDCGIAGHEQPPPKDVPSHVVEIANGTQLAAIAGDGVLHVNSTHHQAIRTPGQGVLVSARAPDGVVEAIELPDQPFALGVQWHPEATSGDPRHAALYRALVAAARDARR
ncbi:MAG TPA: gamma-glutamyl-gamma-aminobutyrate hydrolase family protein [Anaeromyxobacteraceae bacterium]|nr:gamma-glutamyl-gamma-aminobutyrate hydrolase family protein [Anaeromyxobacteraceae bacterium]